MTSLPPLECVVVGLNFVETAGRKLNYVGLMNYVYARSRGLDERPLARPLTSGGIPCLAAVYLTHFLRRRHVRAEFVNLF